MKQRQGEQISALLDGELPRQQHDQVVADLAGGDGSGRAVFGRYRLIGEVMRGEFVVPNHDLSGAVRTALRDEPAILAPVRGRRDWRRAAAGLALAASIAALAVVVAPGLLGTGPDNDRAIVTTAAVAPPLVQPAANGTFAGGRTDAVAGWQSLDDELADRLNRLVIEHHEYGGHTGINGPVAHIGLVSYERR
jgi:sigma-E factor negative regulatory protein RseA